MTSMQYFSKCISHIDKAFIQFDGLIAVGIPQSNRNKLQHHLHEQKGKPAILQLPLTTLCVCMRMPTGKQTKQH